MITRLLNTFFFNKSLLTNLIKRTRGIRVYEHSGSRETNITGEVVNLRDKLWLDSGGIVNVLELKLIRKQFFVTYDSDLIPPAFIVHKPNGTTMVFIEHRSGLYYYDTRKSTKKSSLAFMTNVSEKINNYSSKQIHDARVARKTYIAVGWPSIQDQKYDS